MLATLAKTAALRWLAAVDPVWTLFVLNEAGLSMSQSKEHVVRIPMRIM